MNTYKRYRYPQEKISHAIWLYHRFTLSFRDIEEMLACRGIVVTYETIRQWCLKLTPSFAKSLRKKQGALEKTRQQQQQMRQFVSIAQAQRFLSCHGIINNHFRQQRHLLKAKHYRTFRDRAFTQWAEVTCVQNLGIV